MRIAIRVDASAMMGWGHVKRCQSLAYALRGLGAHVQFVTRPLGIDIAWALGAAGLPCINLSEPGKLPVVDSVPHASWACTDWHSDATETIAALSDYRPDWVIIDHYSFDGRWHDSVRLALHCRMAAIDDLADRPMNVQLLIDHNIAADHRQKYGRHLPEGAMLLGGPRFAILGPRYVTAPRYSFSPNVRSIGIFMGGTDAPGLSLLALHSCRRASYGYPVEIASTSGNPHLDKLAASIRQDGNASLIVDQPDLIDFFARHDLQIGASGGATWERCCMGAPTLAVIAAENQRQVALPLAQLGVLTLVAETPPSLENLAAGVSGLIDNVQLRMQHSIRARTLVDGEGARRVAEQLVSA